MAEVVLNDECMRCKDKECHDGENFCNYAMQKNSFYKNPRLYKGLEVIRLPTYKELEKENAELKEKLESAEKARDYWEDSSFDWRHKCTSKKPFRVAVKAQKQLTEAKYLLAKWVDLFKPKLDDFPKPPIQEETERFLKEVSK